MKLKTTHKHRISIRIPLEVYSISQVECFQLLPKYVDTLASHFRCKSNKQKKK